MGCILKTVQNNYIITVRDTQEVSCGNGLPFYYSNNMSYLYYYYPISLIEKSNIENLHFQGASQNLS